MRDTMLNHGLDAPAFAEQDGFFVVTFPGPNGKYDRLKVPEGAARLITPAIEAKLNKRQRKMLALLAKGEELTSQKCVKLFAITRETANKDFDLLMQHGLLVRKGSGRATRYVLGHPTGTEGIVR